MTCTGCGEVLLAGARFCGSCGTAVATTAGVADEIEHLDQLHATGALDDEEFRAAKAYLSNVGGN